MNRDFLPKRKRSPSFIVVFVSSVKLAARRKMIHSELYRIQVSAGLLLASYMGSFDLAFGQSQKEDGTPVEEISGEMVESEGESGEPVKANNSKRRGQLALEELLPEERRRMEMQMMGVDFHSKDGVGYRKSWEFRSGVTKLYPPYYDGWADGREMKGLYEDYAGKGEKGYTLSRIIYNDRFLEQTGSEFVNFFSLFWIPETYAFSLFTPRSFEKIKDTIREGIIEARKEYAERDKFESFQDYIAFKFGNDFEMEGFVDGYWIEANDGPEHLTYFYTSEFVGYRRKKKEAYKIPLVATATYMIVKNKMVKMDVVREYVSQDDIPILLEFTSKLHGDMKVVNRYGESD